MRTSIEEPIRQPSLSFYDLENKQILSHIWEELKSGLWKDFSIANWLSNDLLSSDQLNKQKNLFNGIQQIVPGTIWSCADLQIHKDLYKPNPTSTGIDRYMEIISRYIESLNAKRIGVHLSGGLDSSIIIATLKHLGVPFVPIGAFSTNYEFRTERLIQEKLMQWGSDGELIDFRECLYYSDLDSFPATQIPSRFFKSYALSVMLADKFKNKGCDVVLGGQGGDSLFVDAIDFNNLYFNIGDEFVVPDEQELVYAPRGIRLLSMFAHKPLIDFICTERIGQKDDPLKWWARKYFKNILPRELSEYSYFGDFFAMTMTGLNEAIPKIRQLMERAYEISTNDVFSLDSVNRFLSQDIYSFEYKDYIRFCSLIAVAVWYNSLYRSNIII